MMTGIKAEQVRLVTMLRVLVSPIVEPFLQVPVLTHLIRLETLESILCLLTEILIYFQYFGGPDSVQQAFASHG